MKTVRSLLQVCVLAASFGFLCAPVHSAGTLHPTGASHLPIQIRDHQVQVTINNGFARTEVQQTFFNPNAHDLEAVYAFPIPRSASLSEVTIWAGERELNGEVLAKAEAERAYAEEKQAGRDAGLASQQGYQNFEFRIHPVPAQAETRMRLVYYQPLQIDTGIGRYVYPLEDGGTDDAADSFWTAHSQVEGTVSITSSSRAPCPWPMFVPRDSIQPRWWKRSTPGMSAPGSIARGRASTGISCSTIASRTTSPAAST